MPTYQYACKACEHRFEVVQAFSDASLTECPECSGRLRKLYGSVGVVFKGSGFYRTDSRSESSSSTKDAKEPAAAKSDSKSDAKSASGSKSDSTSSSSSSSSSNSSAASSSTGSTSQTAIAS